MSAGDADRKSSRFAGRETTETDIAAEKMGRNSLQANDQDAVHNERKAVADEKADPDESVLESFKKLDPDERARRELGKKKPSSGKR